jgi:hypothetical protein
MARRVTAWLAPVLLALGAADAAAQIRPREVREVPPRAGRGRPDREPAPAAAPWVEVGVGVGAWWWFSHFRADKASERFEITGPSTFDARISFDVPVWRQLELAVAPEFAMGDGTSTWVVGVGAALRVEAFDRWWWMTRGRFRVRLAFLAGGFDWDKAPGSFDPGFGAELSAELAFGAGFLPDRMALTIAADLRSLTFDFDPDPDVVESDSAYGGFGATLRFGVRYAF